MTRLVEIFIETLTSRGTRLEIFLRSRW